jgi:hypothetical protein
LYLLQAASAEAYRRIFRLLDNQGMPHLWRVWNYLADINLETEGLERYRQFNIGRQDAFVACQRGATGNVPAACAIGLVGGTLNIAFMAGTTPAVPVENPPRSAPTTTRPTTARAVRLFAGGAGLSGRSGNPVHLRYGQHRRASNGHPGDVVGQCRESMANIAAVLAEAKRLCRSPAFVLSELCYRVYIRHAGDFPRFAIPSCRCSVRPRWFMCRLTSAGMTCCSKSRLSPRMRWRTEMAGMRKTGKLGLLLALIATMGGARQPKTSPCGKSVPASPPSVFRPIAARTRPTTSCCRCRTSPTTVISSRPTATVSAAVSSIPTAST